MHWQSGEPQKLPEIIGRSFDQTTVVLDGVSHNRCTFTKCTLIYRGGPARVASCYIGPECRFQFEDAAAYVLQFLQEIGWTIAPPGHMVPLQNPPSS